MRVSRPAVPHFLSQWNQETDVMVPFGLLVEFEYPVVVVLYPFPFIPDHFIVIALPDSLKKIPERGKPVVAYLLRKARVMHDIYLSDQIEHEFDARGERVLFPVQEPPEVLVLQEFSIGNPLAGYLELADPGDLVVVPEIPLLEKRALTSSELVSWILAVC
jgi:hypothetical protein